MLGIVGAGKGTQARKLAEYLSVPHISTGDIFRNAVNEKTQIGLKAREIMKNGGLVPDEIVLEIVKDRIKRPDTENGYILDGFPRTIKQAVEFDKEEDIKRVFYIALPEDEVIRRLNNRRICTECKTEHSIAEGNDNFCKKCGSRLIRREDDKESTIRTRIKN